MLRRLLGRAGAPTREELEQQAAAELRAVSPGAEPPKAGEPTWVPPPLTEEDAEPLTRQDEVRPADMPQEVRAEIEEVVVSDQPRRTRARKAGARKAGTRKAGARKAGTTSASAARTPAAKRVRKTSKKAGAKRARKAGPSAG